MTNTEGEILSPRLRTLHNTLPKPGSAALSEFWIEMEKQGTPIIEPDSDGHLMVTFVWRHDGSARNVAVIQDWGCDGIREHHMARLSDSNIWYLTRRMRSDTRTTYQLSPSASTDPKESAPYQLDPLNPKTFTAYLSETGNHIRFSLLELPHAPALPWRDADSIPSGTVRLHTPFADQRRFWVYMPPILTEAPLPVLVVLDGRLYKDQLKLPQMLDYLILEEGLPPVAALLVDSVDRSELLCNHGFAEYMRDAVMPWLRAAYPMINDPHHNIIVGSSFGGLAAAFLGFSFPDTWGTVLSQTGWFRWHPEDDAQHEWLARQLSDSPKLALRFWLQVGNLEVAQMLDRGPTQLDANRRFRDVLQNKGYEVSYHEYSGGHDASSLEFPLAKALTEILRS